MEALQRVILSNNWITIIFLVSLAVLFFLKLFEAEKLKGYAASIFNKGFIEIEAEDNSSFFSFFHIGFSFFFFFNDYHYWLLLRKHIQSQNFFFVTRLHSCV